MNDPLTVCPQNKIQENIGKYGENKVLKLSILTIQR